MAKKDAKSVELENAEIIDMATAINEKYGNVLVSGDFLKENAGRIISTGLVGLDIAFHGGVREGCVLHTGGISKAGKSTLLLTIAAQMQKKPFNKNVYYVDAESRLQPELLECIEGLDIKKLQIIKSSKDKILTAEDILSIIEQLIKDDPGCFVILDSLAVLIPEVELSSEMNDQQRATIPKLMYKFIRKITPLLQVTNSILATITHLQANPSGYGSPFKEVGGNAIQFAASYWINCLSVSIIEENGKKVGQDAKFKVKATASGAPGGEPIIYIRYGKGCDKYIDLCSIAEELGIIKKGGAWYSVEIDSLKDGDKYPKFQGMNKLCEYLRSTPKAYETMDALVRKTALIS